MKKQFSWPRHVTTGDQALLKPLPRNLSTRLNVCLSFLCAALSPITINAPIAEAQTSYNWANVPQGAGGFVTGMVIHPSSTSTKYIRTDVGGAYRWETSGQWTPITDVLIQNNSGTQSIESIAIDQSNSSNVYIAAGNNIWKSGDKGTNWTGTGLSTYMNGNAAYRAAGERLAVDPNNGGKVLFFGSRRDGLWRKINGNAWTQITTLPKGETDKGVSFVVFDKRSGNATTNSSTLFAGVMGNGVYKSTNGGDSWTQLSGPSSTMYPMRAVIDSNGVLYVTYSSGASDSPNPGAIYKYSGNTGTSITPDSSKAYCAITIDPTNNSHLMAAEWRFSGNCQLYRTTNGGSNWNPVQVNATPGESWWPSYAWATGPSGFIIDPENPQRTWMTDGIGVWRTDDNRSNSQSWTGRAKGIEELCAISLVKVSGGPLLSGVNDFIGFSHSSLTAYPTSKWNGSDFGHGTGIDFSESQPTKVARVGVGSWNNGFGFYSDDRGVTWTPFKSVPGDLYGGRIAVSATNPNNMVWVGISWNMQYYTKDRGQTWTKIAGGPGAWNIINDQYVSNVPLTADRVNGNTFYLYGGQGDIYRSTDGGANWAKRSQNLPWWFQHKLAALPGTEGDLWMSFTGMSSGNGLYRSRDGGLNWTKQAKLDDVVSFAFGKAAPGQSKPTVFVYGKVNGSLGIYRSDDLASTQGDGAAANWTKIQSSSQGVPPANWGAMDGDRDVYGKVYIGTGGRGVFAGTPNSTSPVNLVSNPSFDAENYNTAVPSGWSVWSSNNSNDAFYTEYQGGSQSGARHGQHWKGSPYGVYTYQYKTGLTNGLYTLRVWAKSSGGQAACYLEAKDYGGNKRYVDLPVSSTYQLVEIKDINVTGNQCTIGIWSDANSNNWACFDDFEFFKQ